jgi:hypothetical protein
MKVMIDVQGRLRRADAAGQPAPGAWSHYRVYRQRGGIT